MSVKNGTNLPKRCIHTGAMIVESGRNLFASFPTVTIKVNENITLRGMKFIIIILLPSNGNYINVAYISLYVKTLLLYL